MSIRGVSGSPVLSTIVAQHSKGQLRSRRQAHRINSLASADSGDEAGKKRVLITGGNTGIGFETAKALVGKNMAVTIACRDAAKAAAAVEAIRIAHPEANIDCMALDLADLASIKDFSSAYLDSGRKLDVLINNAGVMACPQLETKDGFELQFGVNHLGHFALTSQLMPLLENPDTPSRIINVASSAHMFGTMNFDDLMGRNSYQPWVAYGQSKLSNVLFSYEQVRRLPKDANCTVNALHPGVVNTELARYLVDDEPPFWQKPIMGLVRMFTKSPPEGAETSIYLASSADVEGISGKYWTDCEIKTSSGESYDREIARKLWEVSQELVDVKTAA